MEQPKERRLGCVGRLLFILMAVGAMYMTYHASTYFSEQSTIRELDALCVDSDDLHDLYEIAVSVGTDVLVYPEANAVDFWRPSRRQGMSWVCAFVRNDVSPQWRIVRTRDWAGEEGREVVRELGPEKTLGNLLLAE